MLGIKNIRSKISSIKNIQKITKAMEMVASSKIVKVQNRIAISRPYSNAIQKLINNLLSSELEYKISYFDQRNVYNVAFLIISSDKGLCGALNINLFKIALMKMKRLSDKNIKIHLLLIGSKAVSFFNKINSNIISQIINIGYDFNLSELFGMIQIIIQLYDNQSIDKLYIVYNYNVNTLIQKPLITQILPILNKNINFQKKYLNYLYESEPKELLNIIVHRYLESQIYLCVLENLLSEYSARVVTMKNATDNSTKLIKELQLVYNKTRQYNITQELIEIIFGASAI
uniref:ATP synthase gamma chain n=1 Tax=Candidatus Aschnera chinzeii TaxID=1485666 RepID=A0AAT9G452_9ENTR|nr:MAG: F0F1 ATP synthase subunit gamma [Candidatus Aschnera chinzeii]